MTKKSKILVGLSTLALSAGLISSVISCSAVSLNSVETFVDNLNKNNQIKGQSSVFPSSITSNDLILPNLDSSSLPSNPDKLKLSYELFDGGNPNDEKGTLQIKIIVSSGQEQNDFSKETNILTISNFATTGAIENTNTNILQDIFNSFETRINTSNYSEIVKASTSSTSSQNNSTTGSNTLPSNVSQNILNSNLLQGLKEFQSENSSQNSISLNLIPIIVENSANDKNGTIEISLQGTIGTGNTSITSISAPVLIGGFLTSENNNILQKNRQLISQVTKNGLNETSINNPNFLSEGGKKLLPSSLISSNFFKKSGINNSALVINYNNYQPLNDIITSSQNFEIKISNISKTDDLSGNIIVDFNISVGSKENGTFYESNSLTKVEISGFEKSNNLNNNTFDDGVLEYKLKTINSGEISAEIISLSSSKKDSENLTISSSVKDSNGNSFKITSIAANAFQNKGIKTLDLSNAINLIEIKDFSFDTNSIEKVTVPSSVKLIGENAFSNNSIRIIDFQNANLSQLETIDKNAFFNNNLTSFNVFNIFPNLKNINENAFANDDQEKSSKSTISLASIISFLNNHTPSNNQNITIGNGAFVREIQESKWLSYEKNFSQSFTLKNNIIFSKAPEITSGINSSFGNVEIKNN